MPRSLYAGGGSLIAAGCDRGVAADDVMGGKTATPILTGLWLPPEENCGLLLPGILYTARTSVHPIYSKDKCTKEKCTARKRVITVLQHKTACDIEFVS